MRDTTKADIRGVAKYGVRRQIARNVSARLDDIKKSDRMDYMSNRQKQSFNNANAYWKARAKGIKPAKNRNIIKRLEDIDRSYSYEQRYVKQIINSIGTKNVIDLDTGAVTKRGKSAVDMLAESGSAMIIDELINKGFGHF